MTSWYPIKTVEFDASANVASVVLEGFDIIGSGTRIVILQAHGRARGGAQTGLSMRFTPLDGGTAVYEHQVSRNPIGPAAGGITLVGPWANEPNKRMFVEVEGIDGAVSTTTGGTVSYVRQRFKG